jgi:hypothetical protein
MINLALAPRLRRMEEAMPQLLRAFSALTGAHSYFQHAGNLKTLSVSDVLDNGSIEATFQGVRIKFEMLPVFGADHAARGRVLCMHCHCTYGQPVQAELSAFSYDEDGVTDLPADVEGAFPNLHRDSAAIVLHFLTLAFAANARI